MDGSGSNPDRSEIFSSLKRSDCLWGPHRAPQFLPWGTAASARVDHSSAPSAEVKNGWRCVYLPPPPTLIYGAEGDSFVIDI